MCTHLFGPSLSPPLPSPTQKPKGCGVCREKKKAKRYGDQTQNNILFLLIYSAILSKWDLK